MKDSRRAEQAGRLDHIGVVVADLPATCELMKELFGLQPTRTVEVDSKNLTAVFFDFGGVAIEFIELRDASARRQRLGDAGMARIEHIALRVEDLAAAVENLRRAGVVMTDPAPVEAGGRRSHWTDPATSGGVMFQVCELL